MNGRWTSGAALLAVALVIVAYGGLHLWGQPAPLPTDQTGDVLRYYLPNLLFEKQAIFDNRLPLWNPFEFAGMPMLATLEYGGLYPPNLLYALLPPRAAHTASATLHLALLGVFTFLYLRRALRLRASACAYGALVVAFCGWSLTRAIRGPDTHHSMAYLPLVLLLVDGIIRRPRFRGAAWLAAVLALQFLAGETEISARTGLLLIPYACVRLCQGRHGTRPFRALMLLALAGVAALGLAAVQLLPFAEVTGQSARTPGALTYEQAFGGGVGSSGALLARIVSGSGDPNPFFVGLTPLLLAAYGLLAVTKQSRKDGPVRGVAYLFAACGIVTFFLMVGCGSWVSKVYYHLPTGSWFRFPQRFAPFFAFSTGVLGAVGLQRLTDAATRPRPPAKASSVPLAFVGLGAGAALLIERVWGCSETNITLIAFCVSGLLLAAVRFGRRVPVGLLPTAFLVAALVFPWVLFPARDTNLPEDLDLAGVGPRTRDFFEHWDGMGERVYVDYALGEGRRVPKFGTLLGVPCINGQSPLMPLAFWELVNQRSEEDLPAGHVPVGLWGGLSLASGADGHLDLLGVRYLVLGSGNAFFGPAQRDWLAAYGESAGWTQVLRENDMAVFENGNPWPRAFVVANAMSLQQLLDTAPESRPAAAIIEYEPHHVVVRLPSGAGGTLVLTDQHFPGWRAYVDGQRREVLPVEGVFRGVKVNGQEKEVEFVYRPLSFWLGLAVSLLTAGSLLAAMVWEKRRRKSRGFSFKDLPSGR